MLCEQQPVEQQLPATYIFTLLDSYPNNTSDRFHAQLLHSFPALLFAAALLSAPGWVCTQSATWKPSRIHEWHSRKQHVALVSGATILPQVGAGAK